MNDTEEENIKLGWPMREPRFWLSSTLFLLGVMVAFMFFGFFFVIESENSFPDDPAKRVELLWRVGAGLIALTTFATVIWRGMMTDQQTREQRRQNDANDDAAYANLLMEGTKLLAEDRDHHKRAGVAALQKVVMDPKRNADGGPARFQQQGMDILATEWITNYKDYDDFPYLEQVRSALTIGRACGQRSSIRASFHVSGDAFEWVPVSGFREQNYEGGRFARRSPGLPIAEIVRDRPVFVTRARIFGHDFTNIPSWEMIYFFECRFENCVFNQATEELLGFNTFLECNFTSCSFDDAERPLTVESFDGVFSSFYKQGRAPKAQSGFTDWDEVLSAR